jgi:hypothetical protein
MKTKQTKKKTEKEGKKKRIPTTCDHWGPARTHDCCTGRLAALRSILAPVQHTFSF